MRQEELFLLFMGDEWYRYNAGNLGKKPDNVMLAIEQCEYKPTHVLEIGCSNGWRLKQVKDRYQCQVRGIDPSKSAVAASPLEKDEITVGIAEALPYPDNHFNMVIMGFCLFFIDPNNLFRVMAEANRVLVDGGSLIVHDRITARPNRFVFSTSEWDRGGAIETETIWSHTMDWGKLWEAHPGYRKVAENYASGNGLEETAILFIKDMKGGYMSGEYPAEAKRTIRP